MRKFFELANSLMTSKADRADAARLRQCTTLVDEIKPLTLEEPAPSAAFESMVQLYRWKLGCASEMGWSPGLHRAADLDQPYPRPLSCPPLENMIITAAFENIALDIRDVTRLSDSKSHLPSIAKLDDLGARFCAERSFGMTPDQIRICLLHDQVRVSTPWRAGSDYFRAVTWSDAPVGLMNNGGSHHFAAGRYIAGQLGARVKLHGMVHASGLSQTAIAQLHEQWATFVLPRSGAARELILHLGDMRLVAGVTDMPAPFDAWLLLIQRDGSPEASHMTARLEAAGVQPFALLTDRWSQAQAHNQGLAHMLLGL